MMELEHFFNENLNLKNLTHCAIANMIFMKGMALFLRHYLMLCCCIYQLGAAANFGDRAHRQIWGPNVNNNIYILMNIHQLDLNVN